MAQFTEVQQYPKSVLGETCRLFPVPGAHLYTVPHEVEAPLSRALLIRSLGFGAPYCISAMAAIWGPRHGGHSD
jgi:hypothetical protein